MLEILHVVNSPVITQLLLVSGYAHKIIVNVQVHNIVGKGRFF
jgi:hypothetical protein